MKNVRGMVWGVTLLVLSCTTALWSQQNVDTAASAASAQTSQLPRLVKFSGTLTDLNGKALSGIVGVSFALYSEQSGGSALWLETQNVQADKNGHYSVLLGSTKPEGLAMELFVSEQAQWLGVQPEGQSEQARVLLVAVPYALKAGDAETIGGLPASAFVLANGPQAAASGTKSASAPASATVQKNSSPAANPDVTGKGIVDYIPMWDSSSDIIDSLIFQKASAIGINTTTPAATLDVNGKGDIRDTLTLFPKGTDSMLAISGTAFKIDQTGKMTFIAGQTFPGTGTITGITTASGSGLAGGGTKGTLSLKVPTAGVTNAMLQHPAVTLTAGGGMAGGGSVALGGTTTLGLKTCSANQVLQTVSGVWTCANVGTGTITGVTAGTDLTGGGGSGAVTLNLDTTKIPQLKAANTFTGNQTITGNLNDTGNITSTGLITGQTASFTGNNTTQILNVAQNGTGNAVSATANALGTAAFSGSGFYGVSGASSAAGGIGVYGQTSNAQGAGVFGYQTATTGANYGVYGYAESENGSGVFGYTSNTCCAAFGVNGVSQSIEGAGVLGQAPGIGISNTGNGILGEAAFGVWGDTSGSSGNGIGVIGTADDNISVQAVNNSPDEPTVWVENTSSSPGATAFDATLSFQGDEFALIGDPGCGSGFMALQLGQGGLSSCNNYTLIGGVDGQTYLNALSGEKIHLRIGNDDNPDALTVNPNNSVTIQSLEVTSTLTKPAGSFKIDHPLDPANKYLYHSFVESPDMKNIYDGVVTLDDSGEATVSMPEWFGALNRDFRYQLTCIGGFAPVFVSQEMARNQFKISGGKPGMKVSWQVTGTRQDAFANAHRIQVEVEKAPSDRGHYLHPDLYGAPDTDRIGYVASQMKSVPVEHHGRPFPRRSNASSLQRTPRSIPLPLRPVPQNVTPLLHPTAQPLTTQPK
jgi:trimeric autotransporter adhesin